MAKPVLRTHVLETPRPMNAWEFRHWESIHRPAGRLFMKSFKPEDSEGKPYGPSPKVDEQDPQRSARWVCTYAEYDEVTWGLIND